MTDELDKPIGTKEAPKLSAGSVIVKKVTIEPAKEGSKAKIVRLHCLHPEREEPIALSNIMVRKVQGNNITIKKDTLWYNLDGKDGKEGDIRKGSVLANFMSFYQKSNLRAFENSSINTELDASGFLTIKGY